MTQILDALWLATLQEVVDRAVHEIRDSLNGVSLNLDVLRTRSARPDVNAGGLTPFAAAASEQMTALSARTEALLIVARSPRTGGGAVADVAAILRPLAALLVPAAKADGGRLTVSGAEREAPTAAPTTAVKLALAAGLLELIRAGRTGDCRLEAGPEPVVRFSHESADACRLAPAVADALAAHKISIHGSDNDLLIEFPGS